MATAAAAEEAGADPATGADSDAGAGADSDGATDGAADVAAELDCDETALPAFAPGLLHAASAAMTVIADAALAINTRRRRALGGKSNAIG
ncbi:MAG TPA: hypothetical protein VFG00_08535 [Acidothermaceae bacterium]|nr:hypothetical protein [Acidothermaceae bacterium]